MKYGLLMDILITLILGILLVKIVDIIIKKWRMLRLSF
jgi:hypothetical protein